MWMSSRALVAVAIAAIVGRTQAEFILTYPGWRGNNLFTNGSSPQNDPSVIGVDYASNNSVTFPYGMQSIYPCGGLPQSQNRTVWPYTGGAIAFQPSSIAGSSKSFFYVNVALQKDGEVSAAEFSHPVVPPIQVSSSSSDKWLGTVCIPQVPMPAGANPQIGQNATIQVIQVAPWGEAFYSCVDVTLVDQTEGTPVNPSNCFNTSSFAFNYVFTSTSLSAASNGLRPQLTHYAGLALAAVMISFLW